MAHGPCHVRARTRAGHARECGEYIAELLAEAPASTAIEQRVALIISRCQLPLICALSCSIPAAAADLPCTRVQR
jgi:hypothetical protein